MVVRSRGGAVIGLTITTVSHRRAFLTGHTVCTSGSASTHISACTPYPRVRNSCGVISIRACTLSTRGSRMPLCRRRLRRLNAKMASGPKSGGHLLVVREGGLEPPRPISWALAPQASASTNSATRAGNRDNSTCAKRCRKIEIGFCDALHLSGHQSRCATCDRTWGLPFFRSKTADCAASWRRPSVSA